MIKEILLWGGGGIENKFPLKMKTAGRERNKNRH